MSGAWFSGRCWRSFYLVLHAAFGLMILEANLMAQLRHDKGLLGNGWNIINGLTVAFVLYLTYAYISASGSVIQHAFAQMNLAVPGAWADWRSRWWSPLSSGWKYAKAVSRMTYRAGRQNPYLLYDLRRPDVARGARDSV